MTDENAHLQLMNQIDPRLAAILKRNPDLRRSFEFIASARRRHMLLDHLVATCATRLRRQAVKLRALYLEIEAGMKPGPGALYLQSVKAKMRRMIANRNHIEGDPDYDEEFVEFVRDRQHAAQMENSNANG